MKGLVHTIGYFALFFGYLLGRSIFPDGPLQDIAIAIILVFVVANNVSLAYIQGQLRWISRYLGQQEE